jgi:hypothetical protein
VTDRDWLAWHQQYDEADSPLAQRLEVVRSWIRRILDEAPDGPLTLVSMVAGQGRDVIPVLEAHPRRDDVRGRLVELDPRNTALAIGAIASASLHGIDVVTGDAADLNQYRAYVPADLVLMCGLFGNISEADIRRTIDLGRALTKRGGAVIWTRGRNHADRVPTIAGWFRDAGYEERFVSDPGHEFGVGVHEWPGDPAPLPADVHAFTFVGH